RPAHGGDGATPARRGRVGGRPDPPGRLRAPVAAGRGAGRGGGGGGRGPGAAGEPAGVRVLARFSAVAIVALVLVLGPGIGLTLGYVGSWDGLIGTGYGVMVLTKVALLACAML